MDTLIADAVAQADARMSAAAAPSATQVSATVYEICLSSPAPDVMADFYATAMGYRFESPDHPLLGVAVDRRIRLVRGEQKKLGYAAYAVDDAAGLEALRARLAAAGVAAVPHDDPTLFTDSAMFHDPDGNRFIFGLPTAVPAALPAADMKPARLQHIVTASTQPERVVAFFKDVVGLTVSDVVLDDEGGLRTAFMRSNHEHHSFAVFRAPENRLDHHCYESDDWNAIRDWADHFAGLDTDLFWGPGRHGPGNNLFIFVHDPDGNSVELSVELEHIHDQRDTGTWAHCKKTANSWGHALLRS